MTDSEGDTILLAVRSVRRFTEDVGKLLTTARDYLDNNGWRARTTQAISVSTSLNLPHNWLPQDAFLFVFNENLPKVLGVVSVVFDSVERPGLFTLPVVMVGRVRFAVSVTNDNYHFRWARLCDKTNSSPDGSFHHVPPTMLSKVADVEEAEIAVRPLAAITNSELLTTQVLDPLLFKLAANTSKDVPPL